MDRDFISFIASNWADPIADLAMSWRTRLRQRQGDKHLDMYDRGMCCSLVLQLMVMLESYALRAAWGIDCAASTKVNGRWSAADWWAKSDYRERESVLDGIVLRDVIAHNHLYCFDSGASYETDYEQAYGGDKRWKARAQQGRLTHSGLNCIPSEIGPSDVVAVASIVEGALRYLVKYGVHGVDFHHARRGRQKTLWDVLRATTEIAVTKSYRPVDDIDD